MSNPTASNDGGQSTSSTASTVPNPKSALYSYDRAALLLFSLYNMVVADKISSESPEFEAAREFVNDDEYCDIAYDRYCLLSLRALVDAIDCGEALLTDAGEPTPTIDDALTALLKAERNYKPKHAGNNNSSAFYASRTDGSVYFRRDGVLYAAPMSHNASTPLHFEHEAVPCVRDRCGDSGVLHTALELDAINAILDLMEAAQRAVTSMKAAGIGFGEAGLRNAIAKAKGGQ